MIDDEIVAKAHEVMAYALPRRETLRQIKERMSVGTPGPGNDPNHVLLIPVGYRVVYSVEQQPIGWCQHFSFSVDDPTGWPNPNSVALILNKCFDIQWSPEKPAVGCVQMWEERASVEGRIVNAVNLLFQFTLPTIAQTSPEPPPAAPGTP